MVKQTKKANVNLVSPCSIGEKMYSVAKDPARGNYEASPFIVREIRFTSVGIVLVDEDNLHYTPDCVYTESDVAKAVLEGGVQIKNA